MGEGNENIKKSIELLPSHENLFHRGKAQRQG